MHIDKYLTNYWNKWITAKEGDSDLSTSEIDVKVHALIN
jgi:hypothetical protein